MPKQGICAARSKKLCFLLRPLFCSCVFSFFPSYMGGYPLGYPDIRQDFRGKGTSASAGGYPLALADIRQRIADIQRPSLDKSGEIIILNKQSGYIFSLLKLVPSRFKKFQDTISDERKRRLNQDMCITIKYAEKTTTMEWIKKVKKLIHKFSN